MPKLKFTGLSIVLFGPIAIAGCSQSGSKYPLNEQRINAEAEVNSSYLGTVTFPANTAFWNVFGSAHDPLPAGFKSIYWIQLSEKTCGLPVPAGANDSATGALCNLVVGGHVVVNINDQQTVPGDNVFIIPICRYQNSQPHLNMAT
ncbi:hypothetical protein [Pseudoalteromonas sp. Of7M-16]|uniref:hypothetical protein n=1 Tax=Pseudoalteromonas sp. Of7M-16 TaxID=2917756 RepID=UPI001EF45F7C|nr:hypothetical protein [Pseudoalteromonas sp. Of7M-16]MCG7550536.1 hypothetical protein [Pseudoalteromonas sp. Of7M-16]